jgi:hypothetical protein
MKKIFTAVSNRVNEMLNNLDEKIIKSEWAQSMRDEYRIERTPEEQAEMKKLGKYGTPESRGKYNREGF